MALRKYLTIDCTVGQSNKVGAKRDTDFQDTLGRNGSSPRTSIAHQAKGIRTKLRPAPAISAKSISVYSSKNVRLWPPAAEST